MQAGLQIDESGTNQPQDSRALVLRGLSLAYAPLLVEFLAQHLHHDGWDAYIHHSSAVADAHFQTDGNHSFVRRQNLKQLRLGLMAFDGEFQRRHGMPGPAEIVENDAEQAFEDALLDLRNFARHARAGLARPAQQHLQNWKDQRWIDLQQGAAVYRFHSQRDDAGGGREAARKFDKRKLLYANQIYSYIGAQIGRETRSKTSREVFMKQMDRPELVLSDAVRTAEVIALHLF